MRPAFHVPDGPLEAVPTSAESYLRSVRHELSQLQGTVVSSIDPNTFITKQTRYVPQIERAASCPAELLPTPEWENAFGSDFAELRQVRCLVLAPLRFTVACACRR